MICGYMRRGQGVRASIACGRHRTIAGRCVYMFFERRPRAGFERALSRRTTGSGHVAPVPCENPSDRYCAARLGGDRDQPEFRLAGQQRMPRHDSHVVAEAPGSRERDRTGELRQVVTDAG